MREFIRHPSGMPIKFRLQGDIPDRKEHLKDVSEGGLCFVAKVAMEPGYIIHLMIPVADQTFEADGVVVWCQPEDSDYVVGVRFDDCDDKFALRMVEQLVYIEKYRQQIKAEEGRNMSSEEAAREWIERFAAEFPVLQ